MIKSKKFKGYYKSEDCDSEVYQISIELITSGSINDHPYKEDFDEIVEMVEKNNIDKRRDE